MNPPGSAGDGRQEFQVTAMVPIQLPVLGNLACRLLVKVLVWVAWVKQLSVPVPVPRRSARAVVPEAEVEHEIQSILAAQEWSWHTFSGPQLGRSPLFHRIL